MASDSRFVDFVCDQMRGAGAIRTRRMFGEFAIYCDDKAVALVCDNQLYLKPTEAGRALLGRVTEGFPYPGARPHLLIVDEIDRADALARLIRATVAALPQPKKK